MSLTVTETPLSARIASSAAYAPSCLVVFGVLLLTASAKLQVPLWPVPMTLQTYVVLVLAMAYGTRLGVVTVLGYLLMGALGAPVFAGTPVQGTGLPYMLGPTGGYLLGFMLSTYAMGRLAERGWDRRPGRALAAMTLGHVLILACGVAWLATSLGWQRAIALGLWPFIAATILKTILAGISLPLAWRLVARFDRSRR
jgi:biotin transport system substrate-specific component